MQQQAARLGLTDRVHFLGQRSDIADLMMAADLVVLPSLCEGLCNAAIEAQYAAVPLVTSDTGGLADVAGSRDPAATVVSTHGCVMQVRYGSATCACIQV